MTKSKRHILGLSGGKDSAALAIYMRDRVPEMEYVFCDTGKELNETYEFLLLMEAFLGKKIQRLVSERTFEHYLKLYGGYLPSSRMRWCTRLLKLKPFEEYIGSDEAVNYVGIRADENREGYLSTKTNITSVFPFRTDGITKADVLRILEESGVGIPAYYSWRSRSGCYFCFFQRKEEWVSLSEVHPDLFEKAKAYEKVDSATGERFTWRQGETLDELVAREKAKTEDKPRRVEQKPRRNLPLVTVLADEDDDADPEDRPCLICDL
ncbi:MAG: phosphoadenosine phosphosulfate reductase family protein [Nannocystis sp.]|nr:phosphoadenosine phosphosulfate reductase family protein [Nannocystis sp.]MBA3546096.1 phosphoadenosine phosphosulfate reductase family protein [Nannocystis sp.]